VSLPRGARTGNDRQDLVAEEELLGELDRMNSDVGENFYRNETQNKMLRMTGIILWRVQLYSSKARTGDDRQELVTEGKKRESCLAGMRV